MTYENEDVAIEYYPEFLPKKLSGVFAKELKALVVKYSKSLKKDLMSELATKNLRSNEKIDGALRKAKQAHDQAILDLNWRVNSLRDGMDGVDGKIPTQQELADLEARVATDVASILNLTALRVTWDDVLNKPDIPKELSPNELIELINKSDKRIDQKRIKEMRSLFGSGVVGSKIRVLNSSNTEVGSVKSLKFTGPGVSSVIKSGEVITVNISSSAEDSTPQSKNFVYTSDNLTRVNNENGSYKTFSYIDEDLIQIQRYDASGALISTKTLDYVNNSLVAINIT